MLRDRLSQVGEIQPAISQIQSLPSLRSHVAEILSMLETSHASVEDIGRVIETDTSMASKVLQLVNSPLFGATTQITDVPRAVSFLRIDQLKPLVLSAGVFSHVGDAQISGVCLSSLMKAGTPCGLLAYDIAYAQDRDIECAEQSMIAGLLKDVGLIVLATHFPKRFQQMKLLFISGSMSLAAAEFQTFGTNHGEVGAYLLSPWGLPSLIVEAVAFHQVPSGIATNWPHAQRRVGKIS